jgi:DNA-directed RNA polymerase specialized sigma subunit
MVDINKPNMSRQDIADELGVTRQTVAYIEEKALNKIRAELFKRGIDKEDLL